MLYVLLISASWVGGNQFLVVVNPEPPVGITLQICSALAEKTNRPNMSQHSVEFTATCVPLDEARKIFNQK